MRSILRNFDNTRGLHIPREPWAFSYLRYELTLVVRKKIISSELDERLWRIANLGRFKSTGSIDMVSRQVYIASDANG